MSIYRFYSKNIIEPVTELKGSEAHHLSSVLRLKKGDIAELFDGNGTTASAIINSISSRKVTLDITKIKIAKKPNKKRIVIAASIAKGQRFELIVARCTELGVDRICPVIFERTVKLSKNPKILQRWQSLSISAVKQCHRIFLPQIDEPASFATVLENLKDDYPSSQIVVGTPDSKAPCLINLSFGTDDVITFIGPEGGFTDMELSALQKSKAVFVKITDTVLRVETAALAFASILAAKRNCES